MDNFMSRKDEGKGKKEEAGYNYLKLTTSGYFKFTSTLNSAKYNSVSASYPIPLSE